MNVRAETEAIGDDSAKKSSGGNSVFLRENSVDDDSGENLDESDSSPEQNTIKDCSVNKCENVKLETIIFDKPIKLETLDEQSKLSTDIPLKLDEKDDTENYESENDQNVFRKGEKNCEFQEVDSNEDVFEGSSSNQIVEMLPKPADLITMNFEGPCKFGLIFPGQENQRTPCVHVSTLTNKVFLKMNTTIAVKFTLDPMKAPTTDLYIRATAKFCSIDSIQFPVDRCKVHSLEDDPQNKSHEFEHLCKCTYYNLAGHVVRSPTHGAIYCYDPITKRHSVLSPLKSRSHDIVYSFHCKSSCPKGIDRRPLQIVFTLEQLNGVVLGQTSLTVKISTSPKRDRDRSETEFKVKSAKKLRASLETTDSVESDSLKSDQEEMTNQSQTKVDVSSSKMKSAVQALIQHLQEAEKICHSIARSVANSEKSENYQNLPSESKMFRPFL